MEDAYEIVSAYEDMCYSDHAKEEEKAANKVAKGNSKALELLSEYDLDYDV